MIALFTVFSSFFFVHLSNEVIVDDDQSMVLGTDLRTVKSISLKAFDGQLPTFHSFSKIGMSMKSNNHELRMQRSAYLKDDASQGIVDTSARIPKIRRLKKKKKGGKKLKERIKKPLNRRERWKAEKLKMRMEYTALKSDAMYVTIPIRSEKGQLPGAWDQEEEIRKILETPYSSVDEEETESSKLVHKDREEDETGSNKKDSQDNKRRKSSENLDSFSDQNQPNEHDSRQGEDKNNLKKGYSDRVDRHNQPLSGKDNNDDLFQNHYKGENRKQFGHEETGPISSEIGQLQPDLKVAETLDNDEELMKILEAPYSSVDEEDTESSKLVYDDNAEDDIGSNEDDYSWKSQEEPRNSSENLDSIADLSQHNERDSGHGEDKNNYRKGGSIKNDRHEQPKLRKNKNNRLQNNGNSGNRRQSDHRIGETNNKKIKFEKKKEKNGKTEYDKRNSRGGRRVPRVRTGETKNGAQWAKDLKLDNIRGPKRVRNLIKIDDMDGW